MPLAGVERELCCLAGQIAAATCRFLLLLGDFDVRQGWAGVDIRSCAHWLSWRCGLDLRTARALRDLPRLSESVVVVGEQVVAKAGEARASVPAATATATGIASRPRSAEIIEAPRVGPVHARQIGR